MDPSALANQHEVRFYLPQGIGLSPSADTKKFGNFVASPRWLGFNSVQPINEVLSNEMLLEIFSYLRPKTLAVMRLVCKLWTTLADDEVFLRKMTNFYVKLVKNNRTVKPYFITTSPAGNVAELLKRSRAEKSTVEAYQATAKNYWTAVREKTEQREIFAMRRHEHQERHPHSESCCSACEIKCTLL